ncbi:hypothetical protein CBR_g17770 [Chara braunii]|uniref:Uncharacterized protein n=1 Tax=Chara braunii TaxID=69332 RepID=A0A388KVF8_CHABU|nr:hypothetical protein CBR_g17770 [Chara braunii]|eukprot:GBG74060.1 hypothetical protein CBR_g17770 [Chara braunii]
MAEFGPQGLTKQVWVELRKHFHGAVLYVNTCKRTLLHEKESLDDAKKLYDDDMFPKSFLKSVRSILRRTKEEVQDTIRVTGDVRHIKWHNLKRLTNLIPFACPPSQAHCRITEIREILRHYVCNLYVLDLCDPTLLADWREDDFANLQGVLQTLSPTHWALVVFFPARWELSFLRGMARLSVHHVRTAKWVRHAQKQTTVREGNMLVEECDRLYMIFNGENLADNIVVVYPANSPTKASRAHGPSLAKHVVAACSKVVCSSDPSGQAVACFDVADEDRERNLSHLLGLLENFCKAGQTVFFFGKAHASFMWELMRNGQNVVALEDKANMIDYLNEFVKTHVADTCNDCTFVQTTGERNWDPKRDMYWKLSGNKRMEVWDFLFQPGPPAQTDLEYSRRRNLVFGVLNGYHDAPRESVSHFLRRLEHVYFLMAEPRSLENYKAQFDEEDPFDAEDMEELSDSETFDFESMQLPRVFGQVGDEGEGGPRRYNTSPAGLKHVFRREPVDDQSSDDEEEERDYDYEPCDKLPVDHDTWENDRLFFFDKHHRFTPEDVWGHNVVWHPRIFQPTVKNGRWVMAMKEVDGKWSGMNRLGADPFKKKARGALVEHLRVMNPDRSLPDVDAYVVEKLDELYARKMLKFHAPFYALETAPSRGIDWRMPQPPSGGQHPGSGGGGDEGDGGGDGGNGSRFAGKGTGETSSGEKASDGKGSVGKGSSGKGTSGKGLSGKGSGGKGSGGKGLGEKRRTSGSPQHRETNTHCVGSRDSDMRNVATLRSDQVGVDSHLSARTLFPDVEESPSRHAQQRSPVHNTLLLEEGEYLQHPAASRERRNHSLMGTASSFCLEGGMPALRRSEGATVSSISLGERHNSE